MHLGSRAPRLGIEASRLHYVPRHSPLVTYGAMVNDDFAKNSLRTPDADVHRRNSRRAEPYAFTDGN